MVPGNRFVQAAVFVPDLDAAVAALVEFFGFELRVLDVVGMGIRVALCDQGIELVQRPAGMPEPAPGDRLAGLHLRVDDAEAVAERLRAAGYTFKGTVVTPGGIREHRFPDFHGLPLILLSYPDDPGFVAGCVGDLAAGAPYVPQVVAAEPGPPPE